MKTAEHIVCDGCGIDEREGPEIRLVGEGELGPDREWVYEHLCEMCLHRCHHLWAKYGGEVIERLLFPEST